MIVLTLVGVVDILYNIASFINDKGAEIRVLFNRRKVKKTIHIRKNKFKDPNVL